MVSFYGKDACERDATDWRPAPKFVERGLATGEVPRTHRLNRLPSPPNL